MNASIFMNPIIYSLLYVEISLILMVTVTFGMVGRSNSMMLLLVYSNLITYSCHRILL